MSRAYRLKVSESCRRVLRGSDHVGTQLEILDVLPREAMANLLAQELVAQGFEECEGEYSRSENGVTIRVNASTGEVIVEAEVSSEEEIEISRTGSYFDETNQKQREELKKNLEKQAEEALEDEAQRREQKLVNKATDQLEQALADVQGELNRVVNRVTATALKQKAAQLGEIKEMTEDEESGSLTIVLEV